ncbi:MAG: hypothetical protein JOZ31_24245 [Verrucomicrobia bacterium]|nr:hypothetical protein [Verrucomicrobiota bacterium]
MCLDLRKGLTERGHSVRAIQDLYCSPAKISWRLGTDRWSTNFRLETGGASFEAEISAVFVRKSPFAQKEGWALDEATYVHAEKEAALLGWTWGLPCPVINRYPPELWFEPVESLEFWRGRIERFDLELLSTGSEQAVPSYPVAVIGSRAVWDQGAPGRLDRINDSLVGFAESLGLSYLEFRITDSMGKPQVAAVEPFPKYHEFGLSSRREIIVELIDFLTNSKSAGPTRDATDSWF